MAGIEDPRRTARGHILHRPEDIIIIGLCTLVCTGEDFTDMEEFGKQREEWLRKFLELPHGIPDSDTFRRVFERIAPEALSEYLYDWLGCRWEKKKIIAVDGKTIRGSGNESHRAYYVVNAFAAENQLALGALITEEKTNEIAAVLELLDSLNIENSIITADVMSCQKELVKRIREEKASLYFKNFADYLPCVTTKEKEHGQIEKREYYLLTDLSWLTEQSEWTGLNALGMVRSTVTRNGNTSSDIRYFISSIAETDRFAYAIRNHWAIENQLHWALDVIFDEDSSRARKDMSPLNLNILRKTALALCKHADFGCRVSIQKKYFAAALNSDRFLDILFAKL